MRLLELVDGGDQARDQAEHARTNKAIRIDRKECVSFMQLIDGVHYVSDGAECRMAEA